MELINIGLIKIVQEYPKDKHIQGNLVYPFQSFVLSNDSAYITTFGSEYFLNVGFLDPKKKKP